MSPQLELSGDQSLYSDEEPEEEMIELIQSQEDCSVEREEYLEKWVGVSVVDCKVNF
jgi:hypothetical protein